MIIILEGCDKTGKTTLAEYLRDKHKYEIVKCSQPKGDPFLEYIHKLKKAGKNVVFDRFHLGEEVYGPIYRGKSGLTKDSFASIEDYANKLGAVMILCTDTPQHIINRFKTENETFTQEKDVRNIVDTYAQLFIKSKIKTKKYHIMMTPHDLLKNGELDKLLTKK